MTKHPARKTKTWTISDLLDNYIGFNKSLSNGITWFEAFEKCKEHGGLLHSDQANLLANIQKGTYWISYFRRPEYYLAKGEYHYVCLFA